MIRQPTLAAKATDADLQRLPYPMLGSPKIDGIRAVVGDYLLSRRMLRIPNLHTQSLFARPELRNLDGELVVGNPFDKNLMQQTTSGVMSLMGKPNVSFWVFDSFDTPDFRFDFRHMKAGMMVSEAVAKLSLPVHMVPHQVILSYEHLLEVETDYLQQGYEGLMLRNPQGWYKQGRSTLRERILIKVKRFIDGEAVILDFEPLRRNLNAQVQDERGYAKRSHHQANKVEDEMLGTLLVYDVVSGVKFNIGSGFTEAQRVHFWEHRYKLTGKIVKYKSQPHGVKDKPRIPIFIGFRSPLDM